MTHPPRRDQLLDLALGLLEPGEVAALEAHVAGCEACRDELVALRRTRQLLASLEPIEAPARGAAQVLAAARRAAEATPASWPWRRTAPRWLWGGGLGLAGAAALAVLVLRDPAAAPVRPGAAVEARAERAVAVEAPRVAEVVERAKVAEIVEEAKVVGAAGAVAPAEPAAHARRLLAPGAPSAARLATADAVESPCLREARRRFLRDAAGWVSGRVREGRYASAAGEAPLTVEERFGADGRLVAATVRRGDQHVTVGPEEIAARRLEPLPGLVLARTVAEAEQPPAPCRP
jgi:anti-sigma factor RsiW